MIAEAAVIASITLSSQMISNQQFNTTLNQSYNFVKPILRPVSNEFLTSDLSRSTDFISDKLFSFINSKISELDVQDLIIPRQVKNRFDAEFEVVSVKRKKINLIFD